MSNGANPWDRPRRSTRLLQIYVSRNTAGTEKPHWKVQRKDKVKEDCGTPPPHQILQVRNNLITPLDCKHVLFFIKEIKDDSKGWDHEWERVIPRSWNQMEFFWLDFEIAWDMGFSPLPFSSPLNQMSIIVILCLSLPYTLGADNELLGFHRFTDGGEELYPEVQFQTRAVCCLRPLNLWSIVTSNSRKQLLQLYCQQWDCCTRFKISLLFILSLEYSSLRTHGQNTMFLRHLQYLSSVWLFCQPYIQ